jgi:ligand-binding SRPBCC domain-containing protein
MAEVLERSQRIALPPEEAFDFFGDARNLERITPPWLGFRVVTPDPVQMGRGTLIRYRLRLHGVPVGWLTEIREWEPGVRFRDVQVSGPYALWDHTHTFEPDGDGGTNMHDRVIYEIPYGPLGELAKALFVRRDVERIFDFRAEEISRSLV